MPENSSAKPSFVSTIAKLTDEISTLALNTVDHLNAGRIDEAKTTAMFCAVGRQAMRSMVNSIPEDERMAVVDEIQRQSKAKTKTGLKDK